MSLPVRWPCEAVLASSKYGRGRPEIGSASGFPLVLYFHRVTPNANHYTELEPRAFGAGLDLLLSRFMVFDPFGIDDLARGVTPPPTEP